MRTPAVYKRWCLNCPSVSKVLLLSRGAGLGTPTQGNGFAGAEGPSLGWGRGQVKVRGRETEGGDGEGRGLVKTAPQLQAAPWRGLLGLGRGKG